MLKGKKAWKTIRLDTLEASHNRCSICERTGKVLFCHERWKYDKRQATVTLTDFIMACERCNTVLHAGRSLKLGYEEDVIKYLRDTNDIGTIEAVLLLIEAFHAWSEMERVKNWRMKVSRNLLRRYPSLTLLPAYVPIQKLL
jgi:hypothetical protein